MLAVATQKFPHTNDTHFTSKQLRSACIKNWRHACGGNKVKVTAKENCARKSRKALHATKSLTHTNAK